YGGDLDAGWERETDRSEFGHRSLYVTEGYHSGDRISCYYTTTRPRPHTTESSENIDGAYDPSHIRAFITMTHPVLLSAIDPVAEAKLSGLDSAVTAGRPLRADEEPTRGDVGDIVPV